MKVFGTIKDEFGTVDGATIILLRNGQRTNLATITNEEGFFEIENKELRNNDEFEIRYLGLQTQYKKAKELQGAEIVLPEDVEQLDEVVLTSTVGQKPKTKFGLPNKNVISENGNTTSIMIFSGLALITLGTIIYVIKKSK